MTEQQAFDEDLDVRLLPRAERHPLIVARFEALAAGRSFVLVNDHDPRHLREEFESTSAGRFDWEYLDSERGHWRIRIGKRAATTGPQLVGNTLAALAGAGHRGAVEVAWKLQERVRDLDANVIVLGPGEGIGRHTGPEVDVLIQVLDGTGRLTTEDTDLELERGSLVWLPRHSVRQFTAGPDGLGYLTVHQHREALTLRRPGH